MLEEALEEALEDYGCTEIQPANLDTTNETIACCKRRENKPCFGSTSFAGRSQAVLLLHLSGLLRPLFVCLGSTSISVSPPLSQDVSEVETSCSAASLSSASLSSGAMMLSAKSRTEPASGCSLWLSRAEARASNSSRPSCTSASFLVLQLAAISDFPYH